MKIISLLVLSIVFMGCAKKGDSPSEASTCGDKAVASSWTYVGVFTLNLQSIKLNQTMPLVVAFTNGVTCSGAGTMNGSDCAGTYSVSGMTGANCSSLNESGTYTKSASGLRFCTTAGSCTTYQ